MHDIRQLAREASAIILGGDGHQAYRRCDVSNIFINHNDGKKPETCILFAHYTTRSRKKGQSWSSQISKLGNGASRYAHRDGGVGVFSSRLIAAGNIPRFRLWVELGCPDISKVIPLMDERARVTLHRMSSLHRTEEARNLAEEQLQRRLTARKRRRSMSAAQHWREKAENLERMAKELDCGVSQIQDADSGGLGETTEDTRGLRESIASSGTAARMQARLLIQCLAVRSYFRKIAKRNINKAESFERTAAVIDALNVLAEVADDDNESEATRAEAVVNDMLDEMPDTVGQNVHVLAEKVGAGFGISGRTLRSWAAEYIKNETFEFDLRGTASPEHILDDEDVLQQVRRFMAEKATLHGARGLTVEKFQVYVNRDLLPELAKDPDYVTLLDRTLKTKEGTYTISHATALAWMRRAGAERTWFKQGTYTDVHEREDVVAARIKYIELNAELQLRERTWVRMEKTEYLDIFKGEQATELDRRHSEPPHHYVDATTGVEMVEVHADDFEDTESVAWNFRQVSVRFKEPREREASQRIVERKNAALRVERCPLGHLKPVCRCHQPIVRVGHDEAIFKAYALPKGIWQICGVQALRKKTDGPGEMVSAIQCEDRGFGLPLDPDETKAAAELAKVNEYRRAQGRGALTETPGVRFFQYGKNREGYWGFAQFQEQMVDVLDFLEALHPKHQIVLEVDWSQGHAKKTPGGLYVTDMTLNVGGAGDKMRDTFITPGCLQSGERDGSGAARLNPEDWQHFEFRQGDAVNPGDENSTLVSQRGHIGKNKGLRQILWERGLWAPPEKLTLGVARERLQQCEDFQSEPSALGKLLLDRGHVLLMSPKAHPELAGKGIEYTWGKLKREFRRLNDCIARNLHDNVVKTFQYVGVGRVRRFARRTREYMRGYARMHGLLGYGADSKLEGFAAVEKFVKTCKTHRCTLDQDYAYVG